MNKPAFSITTQAIFGLVAFPPILVAIAIRIIEEEKFLAKNLPGYMEYCLRVLYRLVPYVW